MPQQSPANVFRGTGEVKPGAAAAPAFSVITPMRNEERYVEQALRSLLEQDYPPERFEVLVVDGGSTDRSPEIVKRLMLAHSNLRLLHNPLRLPAPGRNVGIRAARGCFIAIINCHSYVRHDFLRTAERTFEETGADCIGRPVELFLPEDTYVQRVVGAARTSWLGHDPHSLAFPKPSEETPRGEASPMSHGILYRREVFSRVGLFDERFDACEDVEFNARVEESGLRTWTESALVCFHHPRASLWALFGQMRRYAHGRCQLLRTRRYAFRMTQAAPALATLGVAMLAAAVAARRLPWTVLASLAGLYLVVVLLASMRASLRRGFRYFPLLPAAYLMIHAGAAIGFWEAVLGEALRDPLGRRGSVT